MIYLGSSMTATYRPKAESYFASIIKAIDPNICRFFFVGIDFDPRPIFEEYQLQDYVDCYSISRKDLFDPSNIIIQHGDFLNINQNWKSSDYIFWVDCDAYFQRKLSYIDIRHFYPDKICAGILPNKGEEYLKYEYQRLGGIGDVKSAIEELGFNPDLAELPTLNTGCVGATVSNWYHMRDRYNAKSQEIKKFSNHYARQQFLMSLIVYTNFDLEIMPKYIHCDGHYQIPEFIFEKNKQLVYKNNDLEIPAFFCHGGHIMNFYN